MSTFLQYHSVSPCTTISLQVPVPRPISGLPNIGNTCYLNAVLNALYYTPAFVDIFNKEDDEYRKPAMTAVKTFCQNRSSATSPSDLRAILDSCSGFNDYKQHCAHSFILTLLSTLDKELPDSSQADAQQTDSLLKRYRNKKCGKLHDLFFVLMDCTFTCSACFQGFRTVVYSRTLSVPIPEEYADPDCPQATFEGHIRFGYCDYFDPKVHSAGCSTGFNSEGASEYYNQLLISERGGRKWKTAYYRQSPCPISTLFRYLFRQSLMTADNKLYCAFCKKETQHIKQAFLRQTGNVLVLHLQRYSEATKAKETVPIEYPEKLDLRKFGGGEYQIFAVISHRGSLEFGHYTANVRIDDRWMRFDDDRVDSTDMWDPSAYILFYTKLR